MASDQATVHEEDATPDGFFDVKEIRRRLPSDVTDKQQRVGVCLIRNPDAPLTAIGGECGVSSTTVLNTLKSLLNRQGLDGDGVSQAVEARQGIRPAEAFDELTPKQQAVVDWFARHPGTLESLLDEEESLTSEKVANAIEADERYNVTLHSTYPLKVIKGATNNTAYRDLVEPRRNELALQGKLEDGDVDTTSLRTQPPREWLEGAGWTLPSENVDSLDEAEGLTEDEKLQLAWENAQDNVEEEPVTEDDRRQYTAPYSCTACGHEGREDFCSKCGEDKRYAWAKGEEADIMEPVTDAEAEEWDRRAIMAEEDVEAFAEDPLVQDMEAINDALEGMANRLTEHEKALGKLRSNAVHENEFESIVDNLEERLQAALDEHQEETRKAALNAVDGVLQNSVRADLVDEAETLRHDVNDLHERLKTVEAGLSETASLVEELSRTHSGTDGRLGLVIEELSGLPEDAVVDTMEVKERYNGRTYHLKVEIPDAGDHDE